MISRPTIYNLKPLQIGPVWAHLVIHSAQRINQRCVEIIHAQVYQFQNFCLWDEIDCQ